MTKASHIENEPQTRFGARQMIGYKVTYLVANRAVVHLHLTDKMRKLASIDLHGA